MKLFEKKKVGNKRKIKILGLKISYKKGKEKKAKVFGHTTNNRLLNYFITTQVSPESKLWYMRQLFYSSVHYYPNFENPRSFNEKIHWLKLNYHNPLITTCCDKFAVKEYVKQVLGADGYTVPTIASWDNVNDIDFDALPDKFVLKVNWSSGYNIIVKDKSQLDINEAKAKISQWMQEWNNSYYLSFNWGYKNMKPVVYAEEYIEQMDGQIFDYKFLCYDGEPKNLFVVANRFEHMELNFYDMNWNLLPFIRKYPNSQTPLEKPKHFDKMVEIARKLSKPFPFVRVDFYELGDQVLLGEMTFYPGGGLEPFTPEEWDYKMGEFIKLPQKLKEEEK